MKKPKISHHSIILLFALLLLAACKQSITPIPSKITIPSTSVFDDTTSIVNDDVENVVPVKPSFTWGPTSLDLEKFQPSLTPYQLSTPEPSETATPAVMAKLHPVFPALVGKSPDKQWLWAYEENPGIPGQPAMEFFDTHLVKIDGTLDWKVPFEPDYFKYLNRSPMELQSYEVFFWMPNDPYLYSVGA